jgi:hypothetical protein
MYAMKTYGGVEVYFQGFLSLAVGGCEDPLSYIIFMYEYKHTHTHTHPIFCSGSICNCLRINMLGFFLINMLSVTKFYLQFELNMLCSQTRDLD